MNDQLIDWWIEYALLWIKNTIYIYISKKLMIIVIITIIIERDIITLINSAWCFDCTCYVDFKHDSIKDTINLVGF